MSYLTDALTYAAAMEAAMITGADALRFALHWQEDFPYWTNRYTEFTPGEYYGDDNSQRLYTLEAVLHWGYVTEGDYGAMETAIYENLPAIQTYFEERPGLQSPSYPTPLRYLDPLETRLLASPVIAIVGKHAATGNDILGTIIRVQLAFNISIDPK